MVKWEIEDTLKAVKFKDKDYSMNCLQGSVDLNIVHWLTSSILKGMLRM